MASLTVEPVEPGGPVQTLVRVPGLREEVDLLHLTDCHVALADDRDPGAGQEVARSQAVFRQYTPGGAPPEQVFAAAMARGHETGMQGLALSGDILHFPSLAGVDVLEQAIRGLGLPWVYALGNHDWHFPHLPWDRRTQQELYPRLQRLTHGDPACQVCELGGVRLVALDNSTYQFTEAQTEFLKEQARAGQPWVLFVHIPLYIASLAPAVLERWQAPIMVGAPGWTAASRLRWRTWEDEPATREGCRFLCSGDAANLVGVFCGHVHFAHADPLRVGVYQYTTQAGFEGGYRTIRLVPGG